jgi:hypothetical protein
MPLKSIDSLSSLSESNSKKKRLKMKNFKIVTNDEIKDMAIVGEGHRDGDLH